MHFFRCNFFFNEFFLVTILGAVGLLLQLRSQFLQLILSLLRVAQKIWFNLEQIVN